MILCTDRSAFIDRMARCLDMDGAALPKMTRTTDSLRGSLTVINDSSLLGGENVGGAEASDAAHDAASDDDGGDADPEPDRRPRPSPRSTSKSPPAGRSACARAPIPDALRNFHLLPDDAFVRKPVVCALFACSSATLDRRVKAGAICAPRRLSERMVGWRVGDLRARLAALRA